MCNLKRRTHKKIKKTLTNKLKFIEKYFLLGIGLLFKEFSSISRDLHKILEVNIAGRNIKHLFSIDKESIL